MQVIQTINDTIRILFSPVDEDFKLLDFLLVQEADNKYLAQIIEIYDDKYDASQNVARVKLFFKVNEKGEVSGYDHFTPSKECEIKKIKRDEILTFINEDKEALTIGLDYQSSESFDINLDFLKNNSVIFADKIEHSNNISLHLASILSRYNKKSVVFDYSGTLELQNAKKLIFTKDVKLPLDFNTINYIWEKGLSTATLETQAICREIFNEIQTFAKNTPEKFIPFKKFLEVIEIQYKATPITELTVLLNKLNAYQKNNIFAERKKDFEGIKKAVQENEITILDFSELKTSWHKEFCEFSIRNIKNAFVFTRLNETNTDADLINFIYDKNPEITLVPSISYTYSKMPHIIERANNFILLPTLNPRRDFGAANFELSSIAQDECILFGQDTENFIFTIKNNKFSDTENSNTKTTKTIRLKFNENPLKEVNLKEKFKNHSAANVVFDEENEKTSQEQIPTEEELDFFEQFEFQEQTEEEKTLVKKPDESSVEKHYEQENPFEETQTQEQVPQEENVPFNLTQSLKYNEESIEEENPEQPNEEIIEEEIIIEEGSNPIFTQENEEIIEGVEVAQEDEQIETPSLITISEEKIAQTKEEILQEEPTQTVMEPEISEITEQQEEETEQPPQNFEKEHQETVETIEESQENSKEESSEDATTQEGTFKNILEESQEESEDDSDSDENISLEDIAAQSIESAFSEVIDTEQDNENKEQTPPEDNSGKLVVDENVVIDLEKIKEHIDTENGSELPLFRNKSAKKEKAQFKAGDRIEHDKYGIGEVVKVINYANRSLLQINFKEVGKRLLDPDIANIREVKTQE